VPTVAVGYLLSGRISTLSFHWTTRNTRAIMLASTAALLIGGVIGRVSAAPFVVARDLGAVSEGTVLIFTRN